MPKERKIKKKTHKLRIVAIAMLALAVAVATYLLTAQIIQERKDKQLLTEQKVRLDAAEKDITDITNKFLAQFSPNEVNYKESSKNCAESSTKYGRGTITCGPDSFVRVHSTQLPEQLEGLEGTLKQSAEITGRLILDGQPFLDEDTRNEGRVSEIVYSYQGYKETKCYFTTHIYTTEQFIQSHKNITPAGQSVMTFSAACKETTKEPIYPLRD